MSDARDGPGAGPADREGGRAGGHRPEDERPGEGGASPEETAEERQSLWLLAASPTIWVAHFLASYITAAVWCAKVAGPAGPLGVTRVAVVVYTALALVGIGAVGLIGYRRHRLGTATVPHDFDTPEDRHRFLGFATLLLSGLSVVAVIYVGLAAAFLETCR